MRKPRLVKSDLDSQIAELVDQTDKRVLATWACDCVERVLPFFEAARALDDRPATSIKAARTWVADGVFRMKDVRNASLAAHRAAHDVEENDAARSAAHAAGQALATAHVAKHSIAAAIYAATAVRDGAGAPDAETAVAEERRWQYQHLVELRLKQS